ncbi:hypothetical protein MJO28_001022 [Puccinia striiformis f. sp. tritici]|uniref:Uncharacterized protein n=1 Tax=Puccinia striiformis f. sp. tritici TaxID=168172 RepID=A0ACC0F171_9BASI|nr:hypothetical protein MJO28_001022 [Puccinia striiformis f. sp. tritici]
MEALFFNSHSARAEEVDAVQIVTENIYRQAMMSSSSPTNTPQDDEKKRYKSLPALLWESCLVSTSTLDWADQATAPMGRPPKQGIRSHKGEKNLDKKMSRKESRRGHDLSFRVTISSLLTAMWSTDLERIAD